MPKKINNSRDYIGNTATNRYKSLPIKWYIESPIWGNGIVRVGLVYRQEIGGEVARETGKRITFSFTLSELVNVVPTECKNGTDRYQKCILTSEAANWRDAFCREAENLLVDYSETVSNNDRKRASKILRRFLQPDIQTLLRYEVLMELLWELSKKANKSRDLFVDEFYKLVWGDDSV